MRLAIPFILMAAIILIAANGCGHAPVMKNCKEVGQTSGGEKIFLECEDI